jgi:hypothetical protein
MKPDEKIILDLCGGTGAWSAPYRAAGYDVRLITLPDYDVRLYQPPPNVYGILAAPPCTEFTAYCLSRRRDYDVALGTVLACLRIIHRCLIWHYDSQDKNNGGLSGLRFWALENPGGKATLRYFLGKPAFIFNPCDYGDPYKKKTNLWGVFKPPKMCSIPFNIEVAYIRMASSRPGLSKADVRSITPPGFARAFYEANQ